MSHFVRPSGPLRWVFDKLKSVEPWTLVGSLSPEDRCLAAAGEVLTHSPDSRVTLLKLSPFVARGDAEVKNRLASNKNKAARSFGDRLTIRPEHPLHASDHEVLEDVQEFVDSLHGQVIVDVSTMPKRWFIPLVRELANRTEIHTLVATNSKPKKYSKDRLATDADSWEPLPGYLHAERRTAETTAIIGVGYHTLNLHEFIGENTTRNIALKLFLPFPSLHPGFRQNWEFVRDVTTAWKGASRPEIVRVPTDDVSLIFDRLTQHSIGGRTESLVMAPFGPKTVSLAMCLLAIARERIKPEVETEIGYTQPKAYAPDYSSEVAMRDGIPMVNAYCIRIRGSSFYEDLPPV
ncbi:MAG: ubiquitin family protein [Planctomycetota bacterium]